MDFRSTRKQVMVLRGAQGDHPTKGREAPEAEAAQPSRTCGSWKANGIVHWRKPGALKERWKRESPAGSSGGSAEGASEGRQPLTGPHLPPAAKAAQIKFKDKAPVPAGHNCPRKRDFSLFLPRTVRSQTARRAQRPRTSNSILFSPCGAQPRSRANQSPAAQATR